MKNMGKGDILIHAGDFTNTGEQKEMDDFCDYM